MRFHTGTGPKMTIRGILTAFIRLIVSRSLSRSLFLSHIAWSSTISGTDDLMKPNTSSLASSHQALDPVAKIGAQAGAAKRARRNGTVS